MERKVGKIFTYKGKTYQVIEVRMGAGCKGRAFETCGCRKYKSFQGLVLISLELIVQV